MSIHYFCPASPCPICNPSLAPKQQCVIEFATKKETLDKVWKAICEGMVKEQQSFSNEELQGSVK